MQHPKEFKPVFAGHETIKINALVCILSRYTFIYHDWSDGRERGVKWFLVVYLCCFSSLLSLGLEELEWNSPFFSVRTRMLPEDYEKRGWASN